MEKIYIETLGCSKNQVDSEKILFLLIKNGYQITKTSKDADFIIINTCCFIRKAKEEAIEIILELANYKKNGKCKKLIVAGCLAQYYSKNLIKEIPEIDLIFGIGDISLIIDAINKKEKVVMPNYSKDELTERNLISYPGSAYLKISEGCSNYCSYCIIPHVRGPLRSREIYDIIEDVKLSLKGMLEPVYIDDLVAKIEVRDTFKIPRVGTVAGCYVLEGKVVRGAKAKIIRKDKSIGEGVITSLKRFDRDINEVSTGLECGLKVEGANEVQKGDSIEVYQQRRVR